MKVNVDKDLLVGKYDERGLDTCSCGCGLKIITKKMFVDFLEQNYPDIDAEANIISVVEHGKSVMILVNLFQKLPEKKIESDTDDVTVVIGSKRISRDEFIQQYCPILQEEESK